MTALATTPDQQRQEALRKANRRRSAVAAVKAEIRSLASREGREHVAGLLVADDSLVQAIAVGKLLGSIHRFGPKRVIAVLNAAEVRSADRRVRELSERQRRVLAFQLRRR